MKRLLVVCALAAAVIPVHEQESRPVAERGNPAAPCPWLPDRPWSAMPHLPEYPGWDYCLEGAGS